MVNEVMNLEDNGFATCGRSMGYGERLRLLFVPWKALAVGAHGRHLRCYLFSLLFFGEKSCVSRARTNAVPMCIIVFI